MTSATPAPARIAEVTRRDRDSGREVVESSHQGHVAVVADGRVVAALGDPARPTFVRSAAKPFQVAACLEILAEAGVEAPPPREIAVAWASHRGEPRHLAAVTSLLARSATAPEELTCPPGVAEATPGAAPSRLQFNCSGKHALFALAGQALGVGRGQLLDPDGALQRRILGELDDLIGPFPAVGVDGCGAPAVVAGLDRLAVGFRALAVDPRLAPVRDAGLAHPLLVGGEGRLESALLAAGVVAKVGAEGTYAAGWIRGDDVLGATVKCEDGDPRGAAVAMCALLEAAGAIAPGTWEHPPPLGGGRPAGVVRASDEVRDLLAGALPAR